MNRRSVCRRGAALGLTALALAVGLVLAFGDGPGSFGGALGGPSAGSGEGGQIDLSRLGQTLDLTGYARAQAPAALQFPRDHGPHPAFGSEWWYYTGNLVAADGRRFGFELTFFRVSLAPPSAAAGQASAFATHQVYMAHLAITDVAGRRFEAIERFERPVLGLAGAQAEPFRVWLRDWQARALPAASRVSGSPFPLQLQAAQDGLGIDLRLENDRPPVLQGERGLSRKGAAPGDASYYYSYTRLRARGTLRLGQAQFAVQGLAWMDREWSTTALGAQRIGWDWFALQLDDGADLMFCRIRRADGAANPFDYGVWVRPDGSYRVLAADEVQLAVTDHWRSPATGVRYPAGWRLTVGPAAARLTVRPLLAGQELDLAVRYWEGAVTTTGTVAGRPVAGHGYVELTGYDAAAE